MATIVTTAVATEANNGYVGCLWVAGQRVAVAVGATEQAARAAAIRAYRYGRGRV